ncbi:hypothetical protein GJ744_011392 [Endocarpon pusillum]|uniref:Postreplication repair E3 ubiquitin-protein ligase RAD18 n=1 Tax=Endocarpon pusillum TaxID=364733 RepID=A0A8H7AKI0_9EURO|nr:hypothetical protein GJ744_011392 [Endocarpon pusillum]
MPSNSEVPDPTDWVGTPLSSLSSLESALQCHVCKELFTTPMITSCSHTFCSLCIRRCLSQDGRCPACRSGDQESKLRRNWAMEECVNVYEKQREHLLKIARSIAEGTKSKEMDDRALEGRPSKRRRIQQPNGPKVVSELPTRSTRSKSRMALQTTQESERQPSVEDSEDAGSQYSDEDLVSMTENPLPEPADGLVACPMCGSRMKEEEVFPHLDQCSGELRSSTPQKDSPANRKQSTSVAYSVQSPSKARQRLGALNYSLLTETALRKKLAEIGIPSHGPKALMQRRHMEWMNLWNASCDSSHPHTKRELLRELEIWERTQGRQIANAQGPAGVMAKDFDVEGWTRSNKDDFADLIRKARKKAHKRGPSELKHEGSEREAARKLDSLEPVADPHRSSNGVVDLTSPAKPPLEQQQHSQGSQINSVAA